MEYKFANRISALQPSAIREILKFTSMPEVISFAAGNPAPEAFPSAEVTEISSDLLKNNPVDALQYSITEGYLPLRNKMREYMKTLHNVGDENDEIIITSGAQQVMELASKSLANEGDTVICEKNSFVGSLNAFRSYGLNLAGIECDDEGMIISELEKALKTEKNVKFIYTIPNFQNPTGVTTTLERRKEMYRLAKEYGVMIVEDNPYGDIRCAGENIPNIKSFDTEGIVIYAGSFSKVLSPGMRVGYAIAPKPVISKMTVCKQVSDVHSNIWSQIVAYQFLEKYDFDAHLEKIRAIYREKYTLMASLVEKYLVPNGITYTPVEGGLFIWCTLPSHIDMVEFCTRAVHSNVAVVPGTAFLTDESEPCSCFRINFSTPTNEQMEKGMEILGEVLKQYN
ncbi:MAG: PLP-dependent aminotransferase family protein [Clostridia bacterium]|nr:PLP-dependent aminotransferase family protein [Clostridia bacterium]